MSEETIEELAAIAEAEATTAEAEQAAEAEQLAAVERELATERAQTRAAVARCREAVLAAEPELPPELVSGETLEELEGSLESARRAVAQIRERLSVQSEGERGFPVGAPARSDLLPPFVPLPKLEQVRTGTGASRPGVSGCGVASGAGGR